MVIWIRSGEVGIEGDVVRREDLARLSDIEQGFVDLQEHGARVLAAARADAATLRAAAEQQAADMAQAAQRQFDNSARLGYASGQRKAGEAFHAAMLAQAVEQRLALQRMRERLAGIVMRSVERIVLSEDRSGLFRRVAAQLDKDVNEATFLKVTVHPREAAAARAAFGAMARELSWPVMAEVVESQTAGVGECRCEWDSGLLDGTLAGQLQALRAAVRTVLVGGDDGADEAAAGDLPTSVAAASDPAAGGAGRQARGDGVDAAQKRLAHDNAA